MASPALQQNLHFCALALITLIISVGSERALADPAEDISFDQQIAPLPASRCLSCHNATEQKGGLDLQREASARIGGDVGSVITAVTPDTSLLWQRIVADEMPPNQHLSAQEKEIVRQWIADCAKLGTDPIDPPRLTEPDTTGGRCNPLLSQTCLGWKTQTGRKTKLIGLSYRSWKRHNWLQPNRRIRELCSDVCILI